MRARSLTLTPGTLAGLAAIQKYRFLTIGQFARMANISAYHAAVVRRDLERRGALSYFGFTAIPGRGKTPKVYFLKRKGWELLAEADDDTPPFSQLQQEAVWMPQMYHRLRLLDLCTALEVQVRDCSYLSLPHVFVEYRRIKGTHNRETTDYVSDEEVSENRIVPDAVFILENIETKRRGLFLLEVDMGTERISVKTSADTRATNQRQTGAV